MKKFLSIALALIIACSAAIPSFAYLSIEAAGIRKDHVAFTGDEFIVYGFTIEDVHASHINTAFESSNEKVATVDYNGNVTVLSAGDCTITVTNTKTGETEDYTFEAKNGGILGISYTTIYYGGSSNININKEKGLVYSSSNEKVATVDENGIVTSKGKGTCFISAYDPVSGATDVCEVHVKLLWWEFFNNLIYFIRNLFN